MAILSNINGKFAVDSTGAIELSGDAGTENWVLISKGAGVAAEWVSVPPIIDTRYVKIAGDTMTGNLVIDGSNSLTVGGVTTIGGTVSVNATTSLLLALNSTNANGGYLRIMKSGTTEFFIGTRDSVSGTSGTGYDIYTIAGNDLKFFTNGTNLALTLDTSQNATFAGSVDIHATTGDSLLQFNVDGDTYSMGIDNSDSDKFKLAYGIFENTDLISIAPDGYTTFTGSIIGNNGITLGGSNKTLETLYNNTTSYRGALGWSYLQMGNNGSNDIIGGNTAAGGYLRFFTNNTNYGGADVAPNGTLALTLAADATATFAGDVGMADDKKLQFGAGNDLRIYHVANSNSYIEEHGAGALVFKSNDYYFQDTSSATALHLSSPAGNATFAGNITLTGGQILTTSGVNLALNPNTGLVSVAGNLTATTAGTTTINSVSTGDWAGMQIQSSDAASAYLFLEILQEKEQEYNQQQVMI